MDLNPYSTAAPLFGVSPTWLTGEDRDRISAYALYEAIYRNVPESFKLIQRGTDTQPIYIPNAKTLIEAKNRYLAKDWGYAITEGDDTEKAALKLALDTLFKREIMTAKFATQKRFGLIRGDQVWHIRADEDKPEGSRISVDEVDPASYFPIADAWDTEKIVGCHLVDQVELEDGTVVIKRQTYRKTDDGILYELSWWEIGAWDDREAAGELKPAKAIPEGDDNEPEEYLLPAEVTSIPVYHIKNNRTPGHPFGSSELQGLEMLLGSVNQAMSDTELALVLEGLGLYATNSSPPVDENDEETDWKIGPGWVLELDDDAKFERINGVSSITPQTDLVNKLESSMREASGVPDIAIGKVETGVAESGIALAFHMAPILSSNAEKESEILAVMDHLLFDLVTMWYPAFEGFTTNARAVSKVGDPLPTNRKAVIEEVVMLLSTDPPLVSAEWAREHLSEKLGFTFTEGMAEAILGEVGSAAGARDPFAVRTAEELNQ